MVDSQTKVRVILSDDDAVYLNAMADLLGRLGTIEVVGTATRGLEVIEMVQQVEHDVLLLDVQMHDLDGIDTLKEVLEVNPDEKIVMLTAFEQPTSLRDSLSAGAKGFLTKETDFREVAGAIQKVHEGRSALDDNFLSVVMDSFVTKNEDSGDKQLAAEIAALPPHLRQIVNYIGMAYSNKEIEAASGLKPHTVNSYIKEALTLLGYRRGELLMEMVKLDLADGNVERIPESRRNRRKFCQPSGNVSISKT